jgi:DNA-binding MarR family transcriptional regulator
VDENDRRSFKLYPSEKANAMKTHLIAERKTANDLLLKQFSPEERILLKRFLRDLI